MSNTGLPERWAWDLYPLGRGFWSSRQIQTDRLPGHTVRFTETEFVERRVPYLDSPTAWRDGHTEVRVVAAEAWGSRGGDEAIAVLAAAVADETDIDVRLAATRALGQLADPKFSDRRLVAAIQPALDNDDPALQYRAVASLRSVTGADYGNDVEAWRLAMAGEKVKPAESGVEIALRSLQWWK